MSAILIIFLYSRYEIMSKSIAELKDTSNIIHQHDFRERKKILKQLSSYGLLDCDQVVEHYRAALALTKSNPWQSESLNSLVSQMLENPENSPRLISVLFEYLEQNKSRIGTVVEVYYRETRNIDISPLRLRLLSIVKKNYSYVFDVNLSKCDFDQLSSWFSMCNCRSMLHDNSLTSQCLEGLNDKRIMRDITMLAHTPNHFPSPIRVCDCCIIGLLYYSHADIYDIFDRHGLSKLTQIDLVRKNIAMFDAVIKDRDKYLKLK